MNERLNIYSAWAFHREGAMNWRARRSKRLVRQSLSSGTRSRSARSYS